MDNHCTQLSEKLDSPLQTYELVFTNNNGVMTERYIRLAPNEHEIKSEADRLNIKDPFIHTGTWSYKLITTIHNPILQERTE